MMVQMVNHRPYLRIRLIGMKHDNKIFWVNPYYSKTNIQMQRCNSQCAALQLAFHRSCHTLLDWRSGSVENCLRMTLILLWVLLKLHSFPLNIMGIQQGTCTLKKLWKWWLDESSLNLLSWCTLSQTLTQTILHYSLLWSCTTLLCNLQNSQHSWRIQPNR